ncbi:MAG TPA: hypothetical protein DDZ53_01845 [Firmicutes bacterium]|nr:hypothetical protein [Bacillota bacterium]
MVITLAFVFGLISVILVTLLVVAVHSLLSFDLTSFSLFFIVPVGAIFTSAAACYGYYLGLLKSNKKLDSRLKWVGVLFAFVAYVVMQYGFYCTAYLDENMDLNFQMTGEHISQFCFSDADEPISFFSFTKMVIESRTISFTRYGNSVLEVKENAVVNWVFFGIDLLGAMFGSVVAQMIVIGSRKYCDQCRRYMKQKDLFKFPAGDQETLDSLTNSDLLTADKLHELLSAQYDGEDVHYDVQLDWCTECSDGYLQLKLMQPDRKGRMTHNEEESIEVRLSSARRFL